MTDQSMSASSSTSTPRKRIGITNAQRAALRRHARTHPRLRQVQLAEWYESEFGHKISQGTISESLSSRFLDLDNDITNPALLDRQKARSEAWPELESALFQWYWHMKDEVPIPDSLLRTKAEDFWKRLAPYQGMDMPTFSNGWLDRFKKRHNIHRHRVSAMTRYLAPSGSDALRPANPDGLVHDPWGRGAAAPSLVAPSEARSPARDSPAGGADFEHDTPGPSHYPDPPRSDGPSQVDASNNESFDRPNSSPIHSDRRSQVEPTPSNVVLPDFPDFQLRSAEHGDEIVKITTTEALRSLHMLELYELQQEDGSPETVEALYKHRSVILKRHYAARKK